MISQNADDDSVTDYEQHNNNVGSTNGDLDYSETTQKLPFFKRALPPLPKSNGHVDANNGSQMDDGALENITNGVNLFDTSLNSTPQARRHHQQVSVVDDSEDEQPLNEDTSMDFAASIEKVKDVSFIVNFFFFFLMQYFVFWV